MFVLIITAVIMYNGSSVDVHSIEFENLHNCEQAAKAWSEKSNDRSFAICVRK